MTLHAIFEMFGMAALVLAIGAVAALAWVLPHRGFHHLRQPAGAALRGPGGAGLARRAPALWAFLDRHFHDARPSWLRLSLGLAVCVAGMTWFVHLMRGVLADGKIVTADHCLHNTVASFDSGAMVRYYSLATNLASPGFVAPLVTGLAILFWVAHRRRESLGVLLALAGSLALAVLFKAIIQRPRPPEAQALFRDSSFPSGHTLVATAVYGFLVYLILRDEPRRAWHWPLALPLLFLIGSVPLSRIYLGMHWPYDTLASVALAAAWLAILVSLFKYPPLVRRWPDGQAPVRWLAPAITGVAAALAVWGAVLAIRHPQGKLGRPVAAPQPVAVAWFGTRAAPSAAPGGVPGPAPAVPSAAPGAYPAGLPQRSEDAVGGPMEPVSLLFAADTGAILAAFQRAGWQLAQPPSVHGLLRELWSVAANDPDPRGPATPAFFGGEPQDLTFEKPGDASGSIRRRHHTRLWRTNLCLAPGCTPLWVATASYDAGIKMVAEPYLLTHRIDPHVDTERDLIARDLRGAGARLVTTLTVTPPASGHNAAGDHFDTDGRAYVFDMP